MIQIVSEESPRSHFTMLPNIVDDLPLSPHAFRLYAHLRRVAGEHGACYQSTRTLAEKCNMSVGMVSRAKKELVEMGLIRVSKRNGEHGVYDLITIVDIWARNAEAFTEGDKQEPQKPQTDADAPQRSRDERKRSQCELKNNPPKNNPGLCDNVDPEGDNSFATQTNYHLDKARTQKSPDPDSGSSDSPVSADGILAPSTPGARLLFAKLQRAANDQRRRGPRKFATRQQKARFADAEARLGYEGIQQAIDAGLAVGILSLSSLIAWCAKYNPNGKGDSGVNRKRDSGVNRGRYMAAGGRNEPPPLDAYTDEAILRQVQEAGGVVIQADDPDWEEKVKQFFGRRDG